jgi:hypothetical protein
LATLAAKADFTKMSDLVSDAISGTANAVPTKDFLMKDRRATRSALLIVPGFLSLMIIPSLRNRIYADK